MDFRELFGSGDPQFWTYVPERMIRSHQIRRQGAPSGALCIYTVLGMIDKPKQHAQPVNLSGMDFNDALPLTDALPRSVHSYR